jgi:6,7-dimethyl-8-ribityllumazine synthase
MATSEKNLSAFDTSTLPKASNMKVGIVVSKWNENITSNLLKGAHETLLECGVAESNIRIVHVPGSFELPMAAGLMLAEKHVEGVIMLGSVIRGETSHFDFVCQATAQGAKDVALQYLKPVIFGVLTDDNLQQAEDRSGGKHGNKGVEAAVACVEMIQTSKDLRNTWGLGFEF